MTVAKVWDGSAWVPVVGATGPIGPAGPVGPSSYFVGPNAPPSTSYLWVDSDAPSPPWTPPTFVSALPGSPVDGQEIYYQSAAMAALGILWRFRYNAASASAYKWEFVGGEAWHVERMGDESASMGGGAVGTFNANDPQLTVPLLGEYRVLHGANCAPNVTAHVAMGVSVGATNPAPNVSMAFQTITTATWGNLSQGRKVTITSLAGSSALIRQAYYQSAATQNVTFGNRYLDVIPVRVG